jgi:hypothetical protein
MSSRTFSKLLGGADQQSTTGSGISSNLEACKGQPFTTDGERKRTDNESKRFKLTSKVDLEKLSEEEKEIYFLHKEACEVSTCSCVEREEGVLGFLIPS